MASQTVSLVAVSENAAKKIAFRSGGKIKVQAGTKYLLQTENSQVAPENITVKRIGKDLLVSFEGNDKPDLTLQNFFAGDMDGQLYGVSEDGQLHAYVRTDGEGFYGPLLIADGESAPIALGGDGVAYNVALVGETDDSSGFILWPLLLGLAGVGAAAAIIHHNRDDGHKTHTSPAPTNIKVMDDVGPIQGQLSSGDITDDANPEISGNGVPGAIIHLFDNGQEIGSTTVAPDGTWTLTPELADGEHSFDATQVVPGQKPSAPVDVIDLIVDTLAPAKPTIEQVLHAVGSIQGPIANGGVTDDPAPTLSGKAEAGSTVTLYDNGQEMGSVVADDNGQWSYTPTMPLSEGEHQFTVDATDKAGNTSEPSDVFSIVTDYTAPVATLSIDVVAGDDVVNLFESKAQQLISGKAGGEFLVGDLVTFTLNGTAYSAAVDAGGDWSVAVAGADLAEDSSIHATLVAHDAAGNSTSVVADHAYSVDLDPPVATLTIDVVAGDDVVNLFESQVPQLISGKVDGEFMPGDLVTFTLNGTAYSAAVNASGEWKVTVAGADLARETSIEATLVAHDAAGNDASVVADHAYIVDVTPPVATLSIDVVASDDVVNLVESQAQQTISGKAGGEFKAGDLVSFTLNGHAYSAAVKASGDWSVSVAGSDLAKATGIHATLVAHDAAGNSASVVADHAYTVDVTPPVATLTIDTVADDDVINLEESKVNQTVSGTAAGEFRSGDIVSFELNDVIYSAAVAADGKWSVAVAGSDLVKDTNIHATLVAHDAAGNVGNIVADHAYTVAINPGTTTLSIDSVTGDDIVNLVESQASQTISGKVVGTYLAGDQVTFTLNGHAYSAALGVDGKWSVAVPGSDLVDDGGHQINATVIGHDLAGNANTATASHAYSVDVTPPVATLTIDVVAGDDVVNLEESKVNQTISGKAGGEFKAGDIVSFKLNDVIYSAAVAADGKWSVAVAGSDLAKDTNIHATLVAHDAAGNSASVVADHAYMVAVDPGTTTLTIDTVAGDDIVNLVESQANQTISGKVAGAFLAGDQVTFTLNGHAYSAAVGADGKWSVTVPGSDLVGDSGRMINATVIGHDLAGNASTSTVSHAYSVDVTPPVAMLSIDSVTSDNTIDSSEAAGNVTVSGKVSGEFTAGDQVSFKLDGTTYSAAVSANGDWSVSVPGSKLVGDTGHRIDASLVAHDAAGNVGTITASHTIIVDTIAPDVPAISDVVSDFSPGNPVHVEPNALTNDSTPVISGVGAEPGDTIHVMDNGSEIGTAVVDSDGNWSFTPDSPLADGAHELSVTAEDLAGNLSSPSAPYPISIDTTPVVGNLWVDPIGGDDIISAADAVSDQTVSGGSSGARAGDVVTLIINGNQYSTTVGADGRWSITDIPVSDLIDAQPKRIQAALLATNAAGGEDFVSTFHMYAVDLIPPNAPSIDAVANNNDPEHPIDIAKGGSTNDTTPVLSGEAEAGSIVHVYDNGVELGTTVADKDGAWTYEVPVDKALENGEHDFTVIAEDAAGNKSVPSNDYPLIIDTIPSPAPVINDVSDDTDPAHPVHIDPNGPTNDNTPVISGEGEPGDIIHVIDNGDEIGTTTVDDDGSWSFTPDKPLADGDHDFTVTAEDPAGNMSDPSAPYPIVIDTIAPDAPTIDLVVNNNDPAHLIDIAKGGSTNDTTPVLSGEAEAGSIVHVYDNGVELGTTVADKDGTWTYEVPADKALENGEHDFTVIAEDAAGNKSVPSNDYPLIIDTIPSPAPVINDVSDDTDPAHPVHIDPNGPTNDNTPVISGEGEPGDIIHVIDNGDEIGTTTVDDDGSWSFTPDTPLADGDHDFTVTAEDPAGNMSDPSAPYPIVIDTIAPDAPTIDLVVNNNDPAHLIDIATLNGTTYSAAVNAAGEWNVSVPGADLAEESNIHATLVAHDVAGNSANIVADHGYDVKIVPPQNVTLTINSVTLDNVINLSESLQNQTITGTSTGARAGDIVSLVIAGTTYSGTVNSTGKWSIAGVPGRQLVADTDHVIDGKIIASDTYGNTTEATTTHAYEVHTSPPDLYLYIDKITGDDIINAAEAATNQQITGTSVGTNPGDVIKITLNGVVYTSTLDAVGSWSVTVPGSGLVADVNHRLAAEIRTTDQWGNTATVTASHNYVVSITLVKPTIDQILDDVGIITGPITKGGVTDDSKPILSGTSDANATVAIYDNGSKIGSAIANGSGKWSFTPTTSLSEGKHDFTVDATSTFGTTSAKSEVFSITTDYTPPVANLSIDVIASNDVINYAKSQAQQTVSGKVTGEFTNGDVVSFTLNGHAYSATVNASGKWSVLVAGADLANADNIQATLVAHDAAGNSANATASHGYSVDLVSTTPQITSVYDAVGTKQGNLISGETTDEARPKFSGTAEANSVVTLYDKGTAIGSIVADGGGNWSYTPATDLADGAHNITVKAVDVAGNTSAASDAFSFTIDLTPAAPVIVSVYDDVGAKQGNLIPGETTDDARPTISGTSEPNRIVVIYDNTVWLGTTNSDANGDWSFTPRFDLANGTHSILARATDGTDRLSGVSNEFGFTISATTVSVSAQRLPAQDDSVSLHATSDHEQAHNAGPETVAVQQGVHSSSAQPQETESQGTPLPGIESPHAEPMAASAEEPAVAPHVDPLGHVVPAVDIAGISDTYYGESDSYVSLSSAEAYLASDANQGIHGAAGVDTLAVAGHDQVLDLTAAHGKVTGMEVIDLTGDGQAHNSLKLSLEDVLDNGQADLFHSGDSHSVQMLIKGDSSDVVNLDHHSSNGTDSTWSDKGTVAVGDISYHVYQNSSTEAELLIQQGVQVHLV